MKMKCKLATCFLVTTLMLSSLPLPVIATELQTTTENTSSNISQELNPVNSNSSVNETQTVTTTENTSTETATSTEETQSNEPSQEPLEQNEQEAAPTVKAVETTDSTPATESSAGSETDQEVDNDYAYDEKIQQEQRDLAMSMSADFNTSFTSAEVKITKAQQAFIDSISTDAQDLTNKYGLYPSVMVAQAILESAWGTSSLGRKPNNNLFGIKGNYKGQSVLYPTSEYVNGKWITVNAKFRKYPNRRASLEDNAKLLRYGVSWNHAIYKGTWRENAKSYKDALAALDGVYATDPNYKISLNRLIENYRLDEYDTVVYKNRTLNVSIKPSNQYPVLSLPSPLPGSKVIGKTTKVYGKQVRVTRTGQTSDGTFYYVPELNGWVSSRAFNNLASYKIVNTKRYGTIVNKNTFFYTKPFNTLGTERTGENSSSLLNKTVELTAEAQKPNGSGAHYFVKGKGWLGASALKLSEAEKYTKINRNISIIPGRDFNVFSKPYPYYGSKSTGWIAKYYGKQVHASKEAKTSVATYWLIDNLGWVNAKAFRNITTYTIKKEARTATVTNKRTFFYSQPFNSLGTERTGKTAAELYHKDVKIKSVAYNLNNKPAHYLIEGYGWLGKDSLNIHELEKYTPLNKNVSIKPGRTFNVFSKPYPYRGNKKTGVIDKFYGKQVHVSKQAITSVATYWQVDGLGWVNRKAFSELETFKINKVNSLGTITSKKTYFYKQPFNSLGTERTGKKSSQVYKQQVKIIAQATDRNDQVRHYQVDGYGWIGRDSIRVIGETEKFKKVQALLKAKYNSSNYGIQVTSLVDGSSASINPNMKFTAASTGKLPAIYYTQKQINAGKLKPQAKYKYVDAINTMKRGNTNYSYMRGGAGTLQYKNYGQYFSIEQILNWTIYYSDNQGANFLGYYAAKQYDATMRNDISKIIGRTWENPFTITAAENAKLMAAIYKQGGQTNQYLKNTVFDKERIPKYLPVQVGHKVGDVYDKRHDIAIVYAKKPYILSVMTKNYITYEQISKMSLEIYNLLK